MQYPHEEVHFPLVLDCFEGLFEGFYAPLSLPCCLLDPMKRIRYCSLDLPVQSAKNEASRGGYKVVEGRFEEGEGVLCGS